MADGTRIDTTAEIATHLAKASAELERMRGYQAATLRIHAWLKANHREAADAMLIAEELWEARG